LLRVIHRVVFCRKYISALPDKLSKTKLLEKIAVPDKQFKDKASLKDHARRRAKLGWGCWV
jgi:hypothetical protein